MPAAHRQSQMDRIPGSYHPYGEHGILLALPLSLALWAMLLALIG